MPESPQEPKDDDTVQSDLPPYTIFVGWKKLVLMVLLSLMGIWSSISNSIYFPAIPTLTKAFHTSSEAINLSLVAYLICQGVVPTISSNLADVYGRRPVVLLSFCVYIAACIGISQTRTYWLLVFLRCVQAGGIAPVIAINSGISGDVCTAADRGGFVGVVSGMLLVGQAFGSLVGSAFISRWGWRAIFVFLSIGSGVTFLFVFLLLPETSRSVVGNGSVVPSPIYRAPAMSLPILKKDLKNSMSTLVPKQKLDILAPYKILSELTVIAVLVPSGLQFTAWTMSLTSLSTVLEAAPFNYSIPHVGLMYLPQGLVCLAGSLVSGKILNMYYRYRWKKHVAKYGEGEEISRHPFNKIRVRLDCSVIPMCLTQIGLLLFGWVLDKTENVAAAIVGTCFVSFGTSCFIAIVTTMLVDLHPANGSASTSCINLVRCLLGAAGVAALDRMTSSLGLGGCYTVMAGLCVISYFLLLYVVYSYLKHLKENAEQ
ncbi:CIC11C00000000950 [Sungouiella intermedia]|uniref:CIC11C00000000950 n=1 Tax=Sungouiella intermedia TaxID=45354 RepID=A0A1L0D224_9ASCO|nr:CIC11C00000000950 [[Candida] intermedia]